MSTETGVVCVVTIHGVGFQQAPGPPDGPGLPARPGYADLLHQNLAIELGDRLSDDPDKQPYQEAPTAPIYVASDWRVGPGREEQSREAGLARLGRWRGTPYRDGIDTSEAPLVEDGAEVAHVALVYTGLEESKHDLAALIQTAALGLFAIGRYATAAAIAGTIHRGVATLWRRSRSGGAGGVSLRVRSDAKRTVAGPVRPMPKGSWDSILLQIEDDVGAYVVRNERRELVRGFVLEALLRLLWRDDVRAVVVNAHSQGTVVAYDVVRQLADARLDKVHALVTAGSPLRKYATVLSWGREIGRIRGVGTWLNVHDPRDPVADPLTRPPSGRRAADDPSPPGCLFWWRDPVTGAGEASAVQDVQVDNLQNSPPGALRSHNYWDNQAEFVPRLAALVADA
jgi:hypothetical protein